MDKEDDKYKAHIIVLPYHGQGHMNPMLQFSKRLAAKGIKITVTTTLSNTKAMAAAAAASCSINFESIYDDHAQGGVAGPGGFKGFLERFEATASTNLIHLITKFQDSNNPVKCLIYDANIAWASNVANELAIARASFFTQSCAFVASCYPMHCDLTGVVSPPVPPLPMPGLPELRLPNLPSLGPQVGSYPPIMRYILSQFDNTEKADWVLFNSFLNLEEEVINWMSGLWPVRAIGPTLPSLYLDNRVKDDHDYGFNIFKQETEACFKWLDSKEKGSVVYVSFGSAASLAAEQYAEVGKALVHSCRNFLWAVKPSEEDKLPTNFKSGISWEMGMVVAWCPQLAVLAHEAVGCFVSHCGWNSTLEAISLGVPMVAMPQFLDQMTNAHLVEHVWKVGIKAKTGDGGFSWSEEIRACIEVIMLGERGREIMANVCRWRALAKEAVDEGGSSDVCIHEIIAKLTTF
ncbi:mogroside IE synthase-like [Salvia miltiorrhiza]|uniref:mogroside IE synthase-like n=1 Tax=Salvia miltiorrhiza TaxID=226208 RepID=UPI0025ABF5F5|nr:mogroside IE synthase-like [Salvia miltiorrhiza]XP_057794752.1 mogroside IE synthase-like [Salvia miltiorrhiza]